MDLLESMESPGGNFLAFCKGKMAYGSTTMFIMKPI